VAAVVVSAVGYFFSLIAVFAAITAFVTLLIGVFNPFTFERVRHYPHPRPIIEQPVTPTPTNPDTPTNPEPRHVRAALGTNEPTTAKPLSAQDKSTDDAACIVKKDAENRKPERKIKPERLAHFHQPKVLARQQQNYEGYGYGMALGYAEGYHPGLDGQR
jgi:hypothetical protein